MRKEISERMGVHFTVELEQALIEGRVEAALCCGPFPSRTSDVFSISSAESFK